MATAQHETRTRTVEEMVTVLTLTEDEADELRKVVEEANGTRATVSILRALQTPETPEAETPTDTCEFDGVTYEMGSVYRDQEGDLFKFETSLITVDGTPRGRLAYTDGSGFGGLNWSLAEVVKDFGPLTKVTP